LEFACFDLISLWDLPSKIKPKNVFDKSGDPIVKSSQKILNTKTSAAKIHLIRALIGPAIELSNGNPSERMRSQYETKPGSNSNPEIQGFEI
jgi:hypothetical protein